VGRQASPQMIFFGAEKPSQDPARFVIPMELVCAFFFLVIALTMIGPGQELGRLLNQVPNRLLAYALNIAGSLAGIASFTLMSWRQFSPLWWFLVIAIGIGFLLARGSF